MSSELDSDVNDRWRDSGGVQQRQQSGGDHERSCHAAFDLAGYHQQPRCREFASSRSMILQLEGITNPLSQPMLY